VSVTNGVALSIQGTPYASNTQIELNGTSAPYTWFFETLQAPQTQASSAVTSIAACEACWTNGNDGFGNTNYVSATAARTDATLYQRCYTDGRTADDGIYFNVDAGTYYVYYGDADGSSDRAANVSFQGGSAGTVTVEAGTSGTASNGSTQAQARLKVVVTTGGSVVVEAADSYVLYIYAMTFSKVLTTADNTNYNLFSAGDDVVESSGGTPVTSAITNVSTAPALTALYYFTGIPTNLADVTTNGVLVTPGLSKTTSQNLVAVVPAGAAPGYSVFSSDMGFSFTWSGRSTKVGTSKRTEQD
jgi:hypothetical protein